MTSGGPLAQRRFGDPETCTLGQSSPFPERAVSCPGQRSSVMADVNDVLKQPGRSGRASIRPSWPVAVVTLCMSALLLAALSACGDGNDAIEDGGTRATPQTGAADPGPTTEPAEAVSTAAAAGPRMTVREYAEGCPEKDNPNDHLDSVSWGSIAHRWEDVLAWLDRANPPEELAAYHDARTLYAEEALAFVRDKPEDEVSRSNEALLAFSEFDSWEEVNVAISQADPATLEAMRAERCW